ncbi:MAG: DUF4340 domain-containing protein [Pirellulaceae bacterium]
MGVIAAISSGVAAWFYPWPEAELNDAKVGQPIFELDTSKIRFIDVEQFDENKQSFQRITLRRRSGNDKWTLPDFANFNASNSAQISATIGSLDDRKILEMVSNNQEDFAKYGVIDPAEFNSTPNKSSLGRKVTLRDGNQETLASLIVGETPRDTSKQGQAYVRIEGQPNVYLLEYFPELLTTQFSDWVDHNLLRLGPNEEQPAAITVDNYRIKPESLQTKPEFEYGYRASFELVQGRLAVRGFQIFKDDKWVRITPNEEQIRTVASGLSRIVQLTFVDVRELPKEVASAFEVPQQDGSADAFAKLNSSGFCVPADSLKPIDLQGVGGAIELTTASNVVLKLVFGNVIATQDTDSKLARAMVILAKPDLEAFPEPTPPEPADGEQLTEEEQRLHARALEEWRNNIQRAEIIANGFNQIHKNWVYLVDDDVVNSLRPEVANLTAMPQATSPENSAAPNEAANTADEKKKEEATPSDDGGTDGDQNTATTDGDAESTESDNG